MNIRAKFPIVVVGGVLIGCLAMTGCTALSDPAPAASSGLAPSITPTTPSASDEFAAQDALVAETYVIRVPAGTFTGSSDTVITVPQATYPVGLTTSKEPTMIVIALNCTGTGRYSITVNQQHPNTVGATCGDTGNAVVAVPLDNPAGAQSLNVVIPNGSQYWLSTYYAKK